MSEFETLNMVSAERLWSHHRTLCREIGPRLLGTEADRRAAGYIESHFARCGYETYRQEYPCPSWEHRSTRIFTDSGLDIFPPEGGACMFSVPCDVKGKIFVVSSLEQLQKADMKGKICLVDNEGELSKTDFRSGDSPVQKSIAEKSPLALLVVDSRKDTYNTKTVRNPSFPIPVCAVSARSGAQLLRERGDVSVCIDAKRFSSRTWNIFGNMPGTGERKIRIFAHYDTPSDSPGSKDNGSGTAVIMEVAEALWRSGLRLPVEFIAFGGEEHDGGIGAAEYVREFPDRVDSTFLAINIDSVGCCGTDSQAYTTGELDEVTASLKKRIGEVGGYHEMIVGNVPMSSDHTKFCRRGIPAIFMHDTQPYFHHSPLDIPRFMSLERLEDVARIVLGVAVDIGLSIEGSGP